MHTQHKRRARAALAAQNGTPAEAGGNAEGAVAQQPLNQPAQPSNQEETQQQQPHAEAEQAEEVHSDKKKGKSKKRAATEQEEEQQEEQGSSAKKAKKSKREKDRADGEHPSLHDEEKMGALGKVRVGVCLFDCPFVVCCFSCCVKKQCFAWV